MSGAPDLIGARHGQFAQQIRVFAVPVVRDARARTAVNGLLAHLVAQPFEPLAVDLQTVIALQHRHQPPDAQAGIPHVKLVKQTLD
jgi:hypothetical protein